ncbi:EAL domain-containing protein [Glaciimonas immobilis]|uniref:EAL domain-containing protein (Putative c-di-GMP-specific phosphodiesterase class I) n=1 Tax=Glaciimonas immobilis TaxID=728004 RepID=A0A840RTV2_9BURK|nr:EAL domain-containing protein [Glaciimonas immobilis]KAF3996414.1 EAL domain-containing protein [Glaciimonas immobilis]MBB5201255.1 EAL domain-containing protein (putative c-di-GMP-specific phosphodiesterase class I) [Glaciimonas immobilis]
MSYPALDQYLARLHDKVPNQAQPSNSSGESESSTPIDQNRVWLNADGRVQGSYFNITLTSVFQPIRQIAVNDSVAMVAPVAPFATASTGSAGSEGVCGSDNPNPIIGYEGFAHSYSANDNGLYLWRLLDPAASDDESIELDRLCRMLHSINFFRQAQQADPTNQQSVQQPQLFLSVHARLLAAVDSNHGTAFRRILTLLGLPQEDIVLQLPPVTATQSWLLNYVLDNYRRNHFRLAVNADSIGQAHDLLERVRPDVLKIDGRGMANDAETRRLLDIAQDRSIQIIFKRLEKLRDFESVQEIAQVVFSASGARIFAQGFFWDLPQATLTTFAPSAGVVDRRSTASVTD